MLHYFGGTSRVTPFKKSEATSEVFEWQLFRAYGEKKNVWVLTQIFKEGQWQDDSDGHEHHQVVPVQVPLTAERGYDEVRDYTSTHRHIHVRKHAHLPGVLFQSQEGSDHLGQLVLHDEEVAGHGCRTGRTYFRFTEVLNLVTIHAHSYIVSKCKKIESRFKWLPTSDILHYYRSESCHFPRPAECSLSQLLIDEGSCHNTSMEN